VNDEPPEPSTPTRSPLVPPTLAEVRHGLNAPHPPATSGDWVGMGRKFDETLTLAQELFRTTRHPMQDAMYGRLRPNLLLCEAMLLKALIDDPGDPVAATMLQEVRRYLGRKVR